MRSRTLGRLLVLALMVGAVVAFFALHLQAYFDFAALNAQKARLLDLVAARPLTSVLLFGLAYVLVAALSLPVATAMTVLAGVLFGQWEGTLVVDLSATLGACLSFLAARYLLEEWVRKRWVGRSTGRSTWEAISAGIERDGLNYLLFLRLIPLFPFFLINLVAGLTPLPLRTFFLGTLVGIVPGTFLYVNAGHQLITIQKPADLLSGGVILALVLLGLFSLVPVGYRRLRRRAK